MSIVEKELVLIPNSDAQWLFTGYLWYRNWCRTDHFSREHFHFKDGQYVKYGDVVFTIYGIDIRSSMEGIFIKYNDSGFGSSYGIIPCVGYELTDFDGEFVFGELIEVIYSSLKKGVRFEKYSEESINETIQSLKIQEPKVIDLPSNLYELLLTSKQQV
tara:strand:+ start:759 stop:1235 length:477 start_codon:yes stop_codon:yes gene_type:complete